MTLSLIATSFIIMSVVALVGFNVMSVVLATSLNFPSMNVSEPVIFGGIAVAFILWAAAWMYSPLPNTNGGIADPGGGHWQQWGFTSERRHNNGESE